MSLSTGTRLGPYEIIGALGAGGMGEVYRARDTRLERDVAIKVLPEAFGADPDRLRRFEHEAQAIAALNHPHICQIHDIGPGYLVLEYVEGESLHGPMAVEQALPLALQIVSALEAAHRRGILHRDLKPANIMVTREGTAKLLDFGLAKLIRSSEGGPNDVTRTFEGTVLGTAAYMSPEQAQGEPLDARADVFSFGAVLYEMLSGTRAFGGHTAAQVLSAVLRDEPPPLQAPVAINRIVRRCLQKELPQRFQTTTEVRTALEQLSVKSADQQPSIAVLPFADMSAGKDHEWFSDGLAEEIINALAHVPGLKVIARTSAFAFKGQRADIRRIAETLGVAHVLEGSVRKAGNQIRVTAQLITAADGSHLWSERYDRELADIFAIQDDIAQAIAAALEVKLAAKPADLRHHTPTLPAYEAFLRGRHHLFKFTPDSWTRAKERFADAMALDPLYAEPHADSALAHLLIGANGVRPFRDVVPLVRAEALKALELDPTEAGPHALIGAVAAAHDYDWMEAAAQFRVAMAATRVSPDTRWAYASFYLGTLRPVRESVAEMERAVEQDPLNVAWRGVLSGRLYAAEMHERALEEGLKARDFDESQWFPHFILAEIYLALGKLDEAIAEGEAAHHAARWHSMPTGVLAGALARAGEKGRAEALVAEMGESPQPIWGRVLYHLLCREIDTAADWYERMISHREPFAVIFAQLPIARALRQSARWARLARMMNLPNPA
jgi:TolB-like protein